MKPQDLQYGQQISPLEFLGEFVYNKNSGADARYLGKETRTMELSTQGLMNRAEWEAKGYKLPKFDREAVTKVTKENPRWIHFGAGNIFRAFQANVMQNILDRGEMETGLIVAEGFDYEIIEKMNRPHDD